MTLQNIVIPVFIKVIWISNHFYCTAQKWKYTVKMPYLPKIENIGPFFEEVWIGQQQRYKFLLKMVKYSPA